MLSTTTIPIPEQLKELNRLKGHNMHYIKCLKAMIKTRAGAPDLTEEELIGIGRLRLLIDQELIERN